MKRYKVIAHRHMPTKLPISWTLIAYLILDRFGAPDWVWGAVIVLVGLLWVSAISLIKLETPIDLVELKDER